MKEKDFYKRNTEPGVASYKEAQELPPTPKKVGPYKIETFLDKGGMSLLYLGVHPDTGATTVVKVLSPKYLQRPDVVKRFLKEAEIISMTNHPNIIKVYGQGEWEKGVYIAMEFVEGISLRQYLLQTPISLKHALEIILEISYALCHLHTHGVIHRDLKPENILVTVEGKIKVIDFGIAQLLTELGAPGEKPKMRIIGTPVYISPEQREDPDSVNFPSDIYSLGIVSYELILGKLSHGRLHLSLMPKGMQKILTKALQPDPKHRYQDIVDFITDVSNYMHSSALEEDKKVEDQLSELSEDLRFAQLNLLPRSLPDWPQVQVGVETRTGMSITGLYYDFYQTPDQQYAIFLCESSAKGARAITSISLIRGMVRSLNRLTTSPSEIASMINDLLYHEQLDPVFPFSILYLDPKTSKFSYLSAGSSRMWRIHKKQIQQIESDNVALGVDLDTSFNEIEGDWNVGDILLLPTYAAISPAAGFDENLFLQTAKDNLSNPPQKIVENLLRKRHPLSKRPLQERPITIIALKRVKS